MRFKSADRPLALAVNDWSVIDCLRPQSIDHLRQRQ